MNDGHYVVKHIDHHDTVAVFNSKDELLQWARRRDDFDADLIAEHVVPRPGFDVSKLYSIREIEDHRG